MKTRGPTVNDWGSSPKPLGDLKFHSQGLGSPTFSCISETSNSLSDRSISLTKMHILEDFCTNILNQQTCILVTCQVHVRC